MNDCAHKTVAVLICKTLQVISWLVLMVT